MEQYGRGYLLTLKRADSGFVLHGRCGEALRRVDPVMVEIKRNHLTWSTLRAQISDIPDLPDHSCPCHFTTDGRSVPFET
jgi:hypothetical protein